jgi:ribosomal protein L20
MHGLKQLNITLNRKVLAEMALSSRESFDSLVSKVKEIKK